MKEKHVYLFELHYSFSYYSGDGDKVPVNIREYVVAESKTEAMKKFEPIIADLRLEYAKMNGENEEVDCNAARIEDFIIAKKCTDDKNFRKKPCKSRLSEVKLSLEEDRKKYQLAVCLIPY